VSVTVKVKELPLSTTLTFPQGPPGGVPPLPPQTLSAQSVPAAIAGIENAIAAAAIGASTKLRSFTMNPLASMPCNHEIRYPAMLGW